MDYVDPRIYGGEANPEIPAGPSTTPAPVAPAPAQVDYTAVVSQGLPIAGAVGANELAANQRPRATVGESAQAAASEWLPFHLYKYFTKDKYERVEGYNPAVVLPQIPFQLSNAEEKFMLEANSPADSADRLERMQEQRKTYQIMGDNPGLSFMVGALDPGYLAIDVLSLGAGRIAKAAELGGMAQRMAAGATAFGATYAAGKAEQQVIALSETEVFVNALVNGAATGALYSAGRGPVPRDESFPTQSLHNVAEDIRVRDAGSVEARAIKEEPVLRDTSAPAVDPVAGEVPLRTVAGRASEQGTQSGRAVLRTLENDPDPLVSTLAKRVGELLVDDVAVKTVPKEKLVGGSRAYYDPNNHTVYISKDSRPGTKLHEITHALTDHKIAYGLANPQSAHGKIVQEMEALRVQAKAAMPDISGKGQYYLRDVQEFISGVFSGKSEFTDALAKLPVAPGAQRSVLGSVVDAVRRVLGMQPSDVNGLTHAIGLTEALAKERLNVTLHRGQSIANPDGSVSAGGALSIRLSPPEQAAIRSDAAAAKTIAQKLGEDISWSLNKTMASYGAEAKKVADFLVDNPLDMSGNSVVSQHRAIRADLQRPQFAFEEVLSGEMAKRGYGLKNQLVKTREALLVQSKLEQELGMEMLRREAIIADGGKVNADGVPTHVTEMADKLDAAYAAGLDEMKRAGVSGAEEIATASGYFSRKWDWAKMDDIELRLVAGGASRKEAAQVMKDSISIGIARANGWDSVLARDVGTAIYERARNRGYFDDNMLRRHQGADTLAEVRSILSNTGIPEARMQRVLDVLAGKQDEAGKIPQLKSRVKISMDESITLPDGKTVSIADMIDMNMTTSLDRYLDNAAATSAFARKGLKTESDIQELRKTAIASIDNVSQRGEFAGLFDNTVAYLKGNPVGEDVPRLMRMSAVLTRMVGLARAGLFQFTEYATMMAHYGAGATMAHAFKELPVLRTMLSDPQELSHLRNILSGNASQDMRLRPFLRRMEDNFEVPVSDAIQLKLNQAQQLVPYLNGLKYIQNHQARVAGNLIVDTFLRAAKGEEKAMLALEKYGLEHHTMIRVRDDINAHGADTSKWSKATYDEVRGPLTKMMDDAVLRNRTGEIPAFAQFTSTGKFLFTFRSFVLGAHNKVLAGSLNRGGFSGLGLLMLYQFPLTYAITAANNRGTQNKQLSEKEIMSAAFGQMGSLGLFSEAVGVALGTKQQFGSPGTIAIDRVYKLGGAVASGNPGNIGAAALNSTPLLGIILPVKAIGEELKDTKKD